MSGLKDFIGILEARPDLLPLQPAASDSALAAFSATLPFPLPATFAELYSWRNGELVPDPFFIGSMRWLDLAGCSRSKAMWDGFARDFDAAPSRERETMAGRQWNRAWLPFMESDCDIFALSLDSCFGYPPGHVVSFHFKGGLDWVIRATSFDGFLGDLARLAHAGRMWPSLSWAEDEVRAICPPLECVPYGDEVDDRRFAQQIKHALPPFASGERVRGIGGPFATFSGVVEGVEPGKVKVVFTVFGRETPAWTTPDAIERAE